MFKMLDGKPVKKLDVCVLIVRKIESANFEMPIRTVLYLMPLTYEVTSEEWSLVLTESLCEDYYNEEKNIKRLVKVFCRSLANGVTFEAPLPTQDYKPENTPYLTIRKGKVRRLKKTEIASILKSQTCLGAFDYNAQNEEFGIDNKRTV